MKDFEHDDPLELMGVAYPAGGIESDRELARVLAEEYALAGFSAVEIGRLFESPTYTASHAVLRRRGPDFVREVIGEVFGGRP